MFIEKIIGFEDGGYKMVDINVCVGSACHLKGSYVVIEALQKLIIENRLEDKIELKGAFCLGHCTEGVSVKIGEDIFSVNKSNVNDFFKEQVMERIIK
ncbi:NADH:ubiquinone oxidoreductase 24 kD subunit [Clostridium tetanomorphum]|nr:NADH:ubiquinone oxidoreductase 24 kD subunit [Clostridium tetanomorphum]